jgi:hypothetical protein
VRLRRDLSINHFVALIAETPFAGVKESGYTVVKNVSRVMM